MWLQEKIDEIRRKPEHIRLRYTWGLSAVSTFFVIIIWIISLSVQKEKPVEPVFTEEQLKTFDELGAQKKTLEQATEQMKKTLNETSKTNQNIVPDQNPSQENPSGSGEGFQK